MELKDEGIQAVGDQRGAAPASPYPPPTEGVTKEGVTKGTRWETLADSG